MGISSRSVAVYGAEEEPAASSMREPTSILVPGFLISRVCWRPFRCFLAQLQLSRRDSTHAESDFSSSSVASLHLHPRRWSPKRRESYASRVRQDFLVHHLNLNRGLTFAKTVLVLPLSHTGACTIDRPLVTMHD